MRPARPADLSVVPTTADRTTGTVQLLVADRGNRRAIASMLRERFTVVTDQSVGEADLYLIEDRLLDDHRADLRERVDDAHPAFCPVVVVRREAARGRPTASPAGTERPLLVDEVVEAPIDRHLLGRRLRSLLVRRFQSQALQRQVSTLEARERELRQFERAVESTGNAIAILDTDGAVEYVNPAFEAVTGYTEADVRGESLGTLQPESAEALFEEPFWRAMRDRTVWDGEFVVRTEAGDRRVVDTTITAITTDEGTVEGFVAVMHDVTQRIQRKQALQDREQELDLLRQILTRYLRHDLRNDLNTILGYAQVIEETASGATADRAETILETAGRLSETSETARLYSTLIERQDEPVEHDLREVVDAAVAKVTERYPETAVEVDGPETCRVVAREGIRAAIADLVENAAKHNDADDPWVRVRFRRSERPRLTIEDNGPGVPDHDLAAFDRGRESPLTHSSGIGVWLSKWVVEGGGGRLSFDETADGTLVTVEFPPPESVGADGLDVPDLKARERRLQTIIDRVTDAIVEVDDSWSVTFLDRQAEEILDVDADAVEGRAFWDALPAFRGTPFEAACRQTMDSRSSAHVAAYHEGIDGWLEGYAYPNVDGGLSVYFREITEQKARERELERARTRMEVALDATDAAVWEWDVETDAVTLHPEVHPVFRTRIETVSEFVAGVHPEDRDRVREALAAALDSGSYEVEYRVPDGETVRWAADSGRVRYDDDGDAARVVGVSRDVTAARRRERELRERVKELSAIKRAADVFESSDAPLEDLLAEFVETLPVSFQYPEVTAARVRYDDLDVSTDDFDAADWRLSAATVTENGEALSIDVVYLEERPPADRGPFLDEEQELLTALVTLIKGHVERKTYVNELARTSDLLTNAERLGDVGAWELDPATDAVYWTTGTRRIHGVDSEFEPTLSNSLEFVHPDDRDDLERVLDRCRETGAPFELEYRIRTATGERRWLHVEGETSERADDGDVIRGYVRDVTGRRDGHDTLESR
jgi:PAS domain S-box-containing protein